MLPMKITVCEMAISSGKRVEIEGISIFIKGAHDKHYWCQGPIWYQCLFIIHHRKKMKFSCDPRCHKHNVHCHIKKDNYLNVFPN